jgi:deoxyribodipyrimidine photo-lyase
MNAIYWFRNDLRLIDQPSLNRACALAAAVAPVFIHPVDSPTAWEFERIGPHRKHARCSAVLALKRQLIDSGSDLFEYSGDPCDTLIRLAHAWHIQTIFCEEIAAPEEQHQIERLRHAGLTVVTTWHSSLLDIEDLPFEINHLPLVFTDFRKAVENAKVKVRSPENFVSYTTPLPAEVTHPQLDMAECQPLDSWDTRTSIPYFQEPEFAGTALGLKHIQQYFDRKLAHDYKSTRNQLTGIDYSTKFSVWLASGAVSARGIFEKLQKFEHDHGANEGSYWIWFELLWRDYFRFLHHRFGTQLYRRSGLRGTGQAPPGGAVIKTSEQFEKFERWCQGNSGEAFVDAGMRELRQTGYLSNRMRQVTASYLVHALGLDWRAGAAWFESQLIDYDVYSNQGNWLYLAGCGTDPRGGRAMRPDKQALEHDRFETYRKKWGTL